MNDRFSRLSAGSKEVHELALREALQLGHNYILPEHLLLALIKQEGGIGEWVCAELGIEPKAVRQAVIKVLLDGYRDDIDRLAGVARAQQ